MTHLQYTCNKALQKQSIRKYIRSIRRNLTYQEQYIAAQLLTNKIITTNHIHRLMHIGIFISIDGEINTTLLIKTLLLMKKKIYLPIVPISNIQYLSFSKYTLSTPLVRNHLNTYEPQQNTTSTIPIKLLDIMFIPLVAFDKNGNRLGMGHGFYDRTLRKYPALLYSYIPIGLGYDFQEIPTQLLPTEKWDIKLPEIITPSTHWHINNSLNNYNK